MAKFILGGSLEVGNGHVVAAVFEGNHEWDVAGNATLRYVRAPLDGQPKDATVASILFAVYDASEGCLIKGSFKMKV